MLLLLCKPMLSVYLAGSCYPPPQQTTSRAPALSAHLPPGVRQQPYSHLPGRIRWHRPLQVHIELETLGWRPGRARHASCGVSTDEHMWRFWHRRCSVTFMCVVVVWNVVKLWLPSQISVWKTEKKHYMSTLTHTHRACNNGNITTACAHLRSRRLVSAHKMPHRKQKAAQMKWVGARCLDHTAESWLWVSLG